MRLEFSGEVWFWRGPSPFHFVTVPPAQSELIADLSASVTYDWGMIPCEVILGDTRWTTSLWPKDGGYIVPLKADVRRAEGVEVGDDVDLVVTVE